MSCLYGEEGPILVSVEDKVVERIRDLITAAEALSRGNHNGHCRSDDHRSQCKGWLAAAANVVDLACGDFPSAYKEQFQRVLQTEYGFALNRGVGDGKAILAVLLQDVENGLLTSLADKARAETFDNFLGHAKSYHKEGKTREAGVIAGVVFEDSIRRTCEKKKIPQQGLKLDELISELVKNGASMRAARSVLAAARPAARR